MKRLLKNSLYCVYIFCLFGLLYLVWNNQELILKNSDVKVVKQKSDVNYQSSKLTAGTDNDEKENTETKESDVIPGKPGHHYLLMWRHPWGVASEGPKEGQKAGDCTITYDKSKLKEAGAVIFHYAALDLEVMPWKHYRDPDQVFIFTSMESPSYLRLGEHRDLKKFDNHFSNWTMTYKWGSDIHCSYFTGVQQVLQFDEKKLEELLAKKSNVALWIVSNCKLLPGSRMRMKLSEDLIQAGLPVHRYGGCFNNKQELSKQSGDTMQSYKFYLAFENAYHCKGYATEKIFTNGFHSGRVPVVWGPTREDAKEVLPPGSYVHADDFDSPVELAQYLLYLNKNDTAYREYFNWRVNPDQEQMRILKRHFLIREEQICDKLQKGFERKSIDSISEWMFGSESKECLQIN